MATKKKTDCRQYRIGDFARYLGVTAEFLKHYQESGLLDVTQRASGYRYYGFDQSARILQYMRLRNYGISVKEMGPFLEGGLDEAVGCLDAKVDEMRAQIERMQAVVEEHERIRLWFEERRAKPVDWEVCNMEPHLHWGFAVRESLLKKYGIPVNEAVRRMGFGKAFVFHFSGIPNGFLMTDIVKGEHPAFQRMKALGFEQAGDALLVHELQLEAPGAERRCCGRFIIPVKD